MYNELLHDSAIIAIINDYAIIVAAMNSHSAVQSTNFKST